MGGGSMESLEIKGFIDDQGNLLIEEPLETAYRGSVRVIVLYPQGYTEDMSGVDDTPIVAIKESLKQSLEEAMSGQRISISRIWDDIDA
jgi:hypothetical protein